MNHKLNKKKVAFVIIIAVLIISLGVFLFNNVNQSTKKETPKNVQEKTVQKEEKKIKIIMLTKIRLYFVLKKEQNSADKCL